MNHQFKIVFADYDYPSIDIELEQLAKIDADITEGQCKTEEDVIELARDADGIICQYAPFTEKVIQQLNRCQIIARYGVGVDNIDIEAATKKGIKVAYVPDYCTEEVSNHAVAMIMNFARQISLLERSTRNKKWDVLISKPIFRLSEQTVGIFGLGRIGKSVAQKLQRFGVTLIANDPYISRTLPGVQRVDFNTLLAESDYITIHAPLNAETRHTFDRKALTRMKKDAFLINTARGGIVDQAALFDAMARKEIKGAALDVLEKEPPDWRQVPHLDNLIITPHTAFYSESSYQELKRRTAHSVVKALNGQVVTDLFNPEVLNQ